jgi:hypothetical protein
VTTARGGAPIIFGGIGGDGASMIFPPQVHQPHGQGTDQLRNLKTACNVSVTATYDWITKVQREMLGLVDCERTFIRLGELLTLANDIEIKMANHTRAYADAVRPFVVTRAVEALQEADVAKRKLETTRTNLKFCQISYQHSQDTRGDMALQRARERATVSTDNLEDSRNQQRIENDITMAKTCSRNAVNQVRTAMWHRRSQQEVGEACSHLEASRLHLLELVEMRGEQEVEDTDLQMLLTDIANILSEGLTYASRLEAVAGASGLQPDPDHTPVVSQTYSAACAPTALGDLTMHQAGLSTAMSAGNVLDMSITTSPYTSSVGAVQPEISEHNLTIGQAGMQVPVVSRHDLTVGQAGMQVPVVTSMQRGTCSVDNTVADFFYR